MGVIVADPLSEEPPSGHPCKESLGGDDGTVVPCNDKREDQNPFFYRRGMMEGGSEELGQQHHGSEKEISEIIRDDITDDSGDSPGLYSCTSSEYSPWFPFPQEEGLLESRFHGSQEVANNIEEELTKEDLDDIVRSGCTNAVLNEEISLVYEPSEPSSHGDSLSKFSSREDAEIEEETAHFPPRPEVVTVPFDLVSSLPPSTVEPFPIPKQMSHGQDDDHSSHHGQVERCRNQHRGGGSSLHILSDGQLVEMTTLIDDSSSSVATVLHSGGSTPTEPSKQKLQWNLPIKVHEDDDLHLPPIVRTPIISPSHGIFPMEKRNLLLSPSSPSFEDSTRYKCFPNSLLSAYVVEFLTVPDMGRLALTCKTAFRLAKRRRWLRRGAWKCAVPARCRPRLWLDACANVRALQGAVVEELIQLHSKYVDEWGRPVTSQENHHPPLTPPSSTIVNSSSERGTSDLGGDLPQCSCKCHKQQKRRQSSLQSLTAMTEHSTKSSVHCLSGSSSNRGAVESSLADLQSTPHLSGHEDSYPVVTEMHGNVTFKVPFSVFYNAWELNHSRFFSDACLSGCYLQRPLALPVRTSRYFPNYNHQTQRHNQPQPSPLHHPSSSLHLWSPSEPVVHQPLSGTLEEYPYVISNRKDHQPLDPPIDDLRCYSPTKSSNGGDDSSDIGGSYLADNCHMVCSNSSCGKCGDSSQLSLDYPLGGSPDQPARHIPIGEWAHALQTEENHHDDTQLAVAIFEYLADDNYCDLSESKKDEIYRDVSRTFPHSPLFSQKDSSGQRWMFDVLKAIGMNFVIAGFLTHLKCPIASFWMSLALLRHYHYRFIFSPQVPQVALRMFQFSEIVRSHLPTLWQHLNKHGLQVDLLAHQWLMSLFTYFVDIETSGAIWDIFFLTGWKAVFKVALGLLHAMEPQILSADCEQILQVVQVARTSIFDVQRRGRGKMPSVSGRNKNRLKRNSMADATVSEKLEAKEKDKSRGYEHSPMQSESGSQEHKKAIVMASQRFKVRSRDLESLEMRFEIRKLEFLLAHIPSESLQPYHVRQALSLPTYNPPLNSGIQSSKKVHQTNTVEHSLENRSLHVRKGSDWQLQGKVSLPCATIEESLVQKRLATKPLGPTTVPFSTGPNYCENLVPANLRPSLKSRSSASPISSAARQSAAQWISNSGASSATGSGDPVRGVVLAISLQSIDDCLVRLQRVIWDLGVSRGLMPLSPQTSQPKAPGGQSKRVPSATNESESLLSLTSTLWSRIRARLSPSNSAAKWQAAKRLHGQRQLPASATDVHSMSSFPVPCASSRRLSSFSETCSRQIPSPINASSPATVASSKDGLLEPMSSKPEGTFSHAFHSNCSTDTGDVLGVSNHQVANHLGSGTIHDPISESCSVVRSNEIPCHDGTEPQETQLQPSSEPSGSMPSVSTVEEWRVPSLVDRSTVLPQAKVTTAASHDDKGSVEPPPRMSHNHSVDLTPYRKPVLSTPTLVFVSLQELICYNRPMEGCCRVWELLEHRNKMVASLGDFHEAGHCINSVSPTGPVAEKRPSCFMVEAPPNPIPKGGTNSAKINDDSSKILETQDTVERSNSGFRFRKAWSRVEHLPELDPYGIDLSLTCLPLPEYIPLTRQDSHRMVDRQFAWDPKASKHVSTVTRKQNAFHLSLGLWGLCLLGRPKPPPPSSARFLQHLMGGKPFGSYSPTDSPNACFSETPILNPFTISSSSNVTAHTPTGSSVTSVKRWHSDYLQNPGWQAFLLEDLLKARDALITHILTVDEDASALRMKIDHTEKQAHILLKERDEVFVQMDQMHKLRNRLMHKKMQEALALEQALRNSSHRELGGRSSSEAPAPEPKRKSQRENNSLGKEKLTSDQLLASLSEASPNHISARTEAAIESEETAASSGKRGVASWVASLFNTTSSSTLMDGQPVIRGAIKRRERVPSLTAFSTDSESPASLPLTSLTKPPLVKPVEQFQPPNTPSSSCSTITMACDASESSPFLSTQPCSQQARNAETGTGEKEKLESSPTERLLSTSPKGTAPARTAPEGIVHGRENRSRWRTSPSQSVPRLRLSPHQFHESLILSSGHLPSTHMGPEDSLSDSSQRAEDVQGRPRPVHNFVNSKKLLAAQMSKVASAERMVDKVSKKLKAVIKVFDEKEDRLEELHQLKKMLIDSHHKLIAEEANFKKDTIENLIHHSGLWCCRLPPMQLQKLVEESWKKEEQQSVGSPSLRVSEASVSEFHQCRTVNGSASEMMANKESTDQQLVTYGEADRMFPLKNVSLQLTSESALSGLSSEQISAISAFTSMDSAGNSDATRKASVVTLGLTDMSEPKLETEPCQCNCKTSFSNQVKETNSQTHKRNEVPSIQFDGDWNAHRQDLNTPFLINEIFNLINNFKINGSSSSL